MSLRSHSLLRSATAPAKTRARQQRSSLPESFLGNEADMQSFRDLAGITEAEDDAQVTHDECGKAIKEMRKLHEALADAHAKGDYEKAGGICEGLLSGISAIGSKIGSIAKGPATNAVTKLAGKAGLT